MTKGRKSTPKSLKSLRGNPRKEKLDASNDPQFETSIPEPPTNLGTIALTEWERITKELAAKQIITNVDQAILALYCKFYEEWIQQSTALNDEDSMLISSKGQKYPNPRIWIVSALGDKVAKYAAELGMTPVARNKVKMISKPTQKTREQSLADNLFRRVRIAK